MLCLFHLYLYVAGMTGKGQLAPSCSDIESLARNALSRLPELFRNHLGHVALIVDDFADEATLAELGIEDPFDLSGLYSGRPVGETAQTGDLPTTIHLFRRPILDEWAESGETLEHLVAHVLVHEVGHHFGLSDDQMHKLENIVA
jgi:predicted Zn-dependent protease with MMP-like domain